MVEVVVNSASVTLSLPLPSDDEGVVVDISWMHFVLLTKEPEGHKDVCIFTNAFLNHKNLPFPKRMSFCILRSISSTVSNFLLIGIIVGLPRIERIFLVLRSKNLCSSF